MTDLPDLPTFSSDDHQPAEPRPFRLTGRNLADDDTWAEEFRLLGDVPPGVLADLAMAVTIRNGHIEYNAGAVVRFVRAALLPADVPRFDLLVRDKSRTVTTEQLGEVMMWATGMATGRPTGPSSSSTAGRRDEGAGSEAEPPTPGTPEAG